MLLRMMKLPWGQEGVADSLCNPNDTVCVEVSQFSSSLSPLLLRRGLGELPQVLNGRDLIATSDVPWTSSHFIA